MVNTSASEIGLGWSLIAGSAITRSVSGTPDDWNEVATVNGIFQDKRNHTGPLNFHKSLSNYSAPSTIYISGDNHYDFYESSYQLEDQKFYFPNYDFYQIRGPYITGVIEPKLFEFADVEFANNSSDYLTADYGGPDQFNSTSFVKKPQFHYRNSYSGEAYSLAYPNPLTQSTPVILPENISLAYDGGGYINNNNQNRLVTPRHVEYFTNQEIYDHYEGTQSDVIEGFSDFEVVTSTSTRTNVTKYDVDGIGAYRITDENGVTYHFSLPVYKENIIEGAYPLSNEYRFEDDEPFLLAGSDASDYIKSKSSIFGQIVETKRVPKQAESWLLVAITGLSYIDDNDNGTVDVGDKGYWVKYDWKPWVLDFKRKYPFYGFNYIFSAIEEEVPDNLPVSDPNKISGKIGQSLEFDAELYYLNSVQTSTHTAIFIRDIRLDERNALSFHGKAFTRVNMTLASMPNALTEEGFLYDNGGPDGVVIDLGSLNGGVPPANQNFASTIVIKPEKAGFTVNRIELTFDQFDFRTERGDYLEIYAGDGVNSANLIGRYGSTKYNQLGLGRQCQDNPGVADSDCLIPPGTVISTPTGFNAITVKHFTSNQKTFPPRTTFETAFIPSNGFAISWKAFFTTSPQAVKAVPQLKLDKIVLLTNEGLAQINVPSFFFSVDPIWDLSSTTVTNYNGSFGNSEIYTSDWFSAVRTASIYQDLFLKVVELEQDYSLAKANHSNVNVSLPTQFLLTTTAPDDVLDNLVVNNYAQSGKLTLNAITFLDLQQEQIVPSFEFDYHKSNVSENPDFNPFKQDNWGFYKLDGVGKSINQYTSESSKEFTHAWSLKKITLPVGGELEIEYESNEYEKVKAEDVAFKGPSRIYPIVGITQKSLLGLDWGLEVESNSEFWQLVDNIPAGSDQHIFLTFTSAPPTLCFGGEFHMFSSSGSGVFSSQDESVSGLNFYHHDDGNVSILSALPFCGSMEYTGKGYVNFDFPIGTKVPGGGPRVKRLIARNGVQDAMLSTYTYFDGVARGENEIVKRPKLVEDAFGVSNHIKLRSDDFDKHRPPSLIGYGEVIIETLGRDGIADGSLSYDFFTTDSEKSDFQTVTVFEEETGVDLQINCGPNMDGFVDKNYVIEVTDPSSSFWGLPKRIEVRDKNNNIMALTKNTYSHFLQGSVVEHFNFFTESVSPQYSGMGPQNFPDCTQRENIICIRRSFPTKLEKASVFENNLEIKTEYLDYDKITGRAIKAKTTDASTGVTILETSQAYTISEFSEMGSKAINSGYANMLTEIGETRVTNDPQLTGNGDFNTHEVNHFSKKAQIRKFDGSSAQYINEEDADHLWRLQSSYSWTGPVGLYGIYKSSDYADINQNPGEVFNVKRVGTTLFQTFPGVTNGYAVGDEVFIKGLPGFNGVQTITLAVGNIFSLGTVVPPGLLQIGTVQKDFIDPKWRINAEIMLTDERQHVLESAGINGRSTAYKYGYDNKYLLASIFNSNYASFTCSGFEDKIVEDPGGTPRYFFEGELNYDNNDPNSRLESDGTRSAHTGSFYVKVVNGSTNIPSYKVIYGNKLGLKTGKSYRASVWVHQDSPADAKLKVDLNGSTVTSILIRRDASDAVQVGEWILLNLDIDVPENYSSTGATHDLVISLDAGSGPAYFDDFRVHAVSSPLIVNVYDDLARVIAKLDNNNYATKYVYDNASRLKEVFQETEEFGLIKIKQFNYEFARD